MSLAISKTFDPISPFKHAPLDHTQPSIRIIKVLPHLSREGLLQCTLAHGNTTDDYTCLSYTWGDENTGYPILIDGQLYMVRRNLRNFLYAIRQLHPLRPLWIDAVCIDQCNTAERNHQVAQMAAIYAAAAHVVIWLGNSSNMTRFFCLWNERCESESRVSWWKREKVELERVKAGWIELANHEYWTRAWITQEIAHSRKLSLLVGIVEVNDFRYITHVPWRQAIETDTRFQTHIDIAQNRGMILGIPLSSALCRLSHQKCRNQRDRIYSLLGLAAEGAMIPVDYGSSDLNLLQMILEACKDLRCLCGLEVIARTLGSMRALDTATSAEVYLIRLKTLVPLATVVTHGTSRHYVFRVDNLCPKQTGNYFLVVSDFGETEKRQQVGRFIRGAIPTFKTWCLYSCSSPHCTSQQPQWPGLDIPAKRNVYYSLGRGEWPIGVGAKHQKTLSWHSLMSPGIRVSNRFRMVLHTNDIVEGTQSYDLDVPVPVLWSYAHQFNAFEKSQTRLRPNSGFRLGGYVDHRTGCPEHIQGRIVITRQQSISLEDVWWHKEDDGYFREQ